VRVTSLSIANFRSIEAAQFAFEPGFNLIVGVNGAGKSTVLEALRVCASRVLPLVSPSRSQPLSFAIDDIRFGFPFLDVSLAVKIGDQDFRLTRHQRRETFDSDDEKNVEGLRRQNVYGRGLGRCSAIWLTLMGCPPPTRSCRTKQL
jgi:DNA repair exonuclease SbcCD ATPase subunit